MGTLDDLRPLEERRHLHMEGAERLGKVADIAVVCGGRFLAARPGPLSRF